MRWPLALVAVTSLVACAPAATVLVAEPSSFERTYFIAHDGDDARDGLTPATAWRTLDRLEQLSSLAPSTRVAFERGAEFRGVINARGGGARGWVAYDSYGDPSLPPAKILGSVRLDPSLWSAPDARGVRSQPWPTPAGLDANDAEAGPGNLFVLDARGAVIDVGVRTQSAPTQAGEFSYDPATRALLLWPKAQWDLSSARIEAGVNRTVLSVRGQTQTIVQDLSFAFGGGYAIIATHAVGLRIRRIDVSWTGGGTKPREYVRLGNGVEIRGSSRDVIVEDSRFFQIYDTGVDVQNTGATPITMQRVAFRRNVISHSGLACTELWARGGAGSLMEDVRFEHNTCLFTGSGWGFAQHPAESQIGGDVVLFEHGTDARQIVVRDNIFYRPRLVFFSEYQPRQTATRALVRTLELDHNLAFGFSSHAAVLYRGTSLATSEVFDSFDAWRGAVVEGVALAKESTGVSFDPMFVRPPSGADPFDGDLRLSPQSPARNAASDGADFGAPVAP